MNKVKNVTGVLELVIIVLRREKLLAGVNILHKWVKLFPDGNFHVQKQKLFPEMVRELRLFAEYFNFK